MPADAAALRQAQGVGIVDREHAAQPRGEIAGIHRLLQVVAQRHWCSGNSSRKSGSTSAARKPEKPTPDRHVVPHQVVIAQAALELMQHAPLAPVAALVDVGQALGEEGHEGLGQLASPGFRSRGPQPFPPVPPAAKREPVMSGRGTDGGGARRAASASHARTSRRAPWAAGRGRRTQSCLSCGRGDRQCTDSPLQPDHALQTLPAGL